MTEMHGQATRRGRPRESRLSQDDVAFIKKKIDERYTTKANFYQAAFSIASDPKYAGHDQPSNVETVTRAFTSAFTQNQSAARALPKLYWLILKELLDITRDSLPSRTEVAAQTPTADSDAPSGLGAVPEKSASNLVGSAGDFFSRYKSQLSPGARRIFQIAVGVAVDEEFGVHSSQLLRAMGSALICFQPSPQEIKIEPLDRENSEDYLNLAKEEGAMERPCSGYLFSAVRRLLRTKGTSYRVTPQDLLNAVLANAQGSEARALRRILGK